MLSLQWPTSFVITLLFLLPATSVKFRQRTPCMQFGAVKRSMWCGLTCAGLNKWSHSPPPLDFFDLIFRFLQVSKEYRVKFSPSLRGSCGIGVMLYAWANQSNQHS